MRAGSEFESLVQWIARTLYAGSVVTANARLPDRDAPSNLREIDILVEIPLGLVPVRIIGEVRDHLGPQDVTWIEQVAEKTRSVAAHAAFVVSRRGFSELARSKARARGIAAYSYSEATNQNWGSTILPMQLTQWEYTTEINIDPVDAWTGGTFPLDRDYLQRYAVKGPAGIPSDEIPDGRSMIGREFREIVARSIEEARPSLRCERDRVDVSFDHVLRRPLKFKDRAGGTRRVGTFKVRTTVGIQPKLVPMVLMRLIDEAEDQVRAQIFETIAHIGQRAFQIRLLTEGEGRLVPAGSQLGFSVTPANESAAADFDGFEVQSTELPDEAHPAGVPLVSLALRLRLKPGSE